MHWRRAGLTKLRLYHCVVMPYHVISSHRWRTGKQRSNLPRRPLATTWLTQNMVSPLRALSTSRRIFCSTLFIIMTPTIIIGCLCRPTAFVDSPAHSDYPPPPCGTKGTIHAGIAGGLVLQSQAAHEDHGAQAGQAGGPRVQGRGDLAKALFYHGDGEPSFLTNFTSSSITVVRGASCSFIVLLLPY